MGFTNVVWESRSTEQLARDLTTGPGPASVGEAGAAWIRVANEFAKISADYDKLMELLRTSWSSHTTNAAAGKLEEFGKWLQAASVGAAENGRKIEEAAVANTTAILSMPSVSEALEAKAAQEMNASLGAYNGAILNGSFAHFDETATASQADAAAVMNRYEDAVAAAQLDKPWDQPPPPQVVNGDALKAEKDGKGKHGGGKGGGGGGGAPRQLNPLTATMAKSSGEAKEVKNTQFSSGSNGSNGSMRGGGYGPMAGHGRSSSDREHESIRPASSLEGGGEPGAGVSDAGQSWLPAAQQNDSPFAVSNVSWGPSTAMFDDLAAPEPAQAPGFAEEPERTLEQVSDHWVSNPVIGADHEATL